MRIGDNQKVDVIESRSNGGGKGEHIEQGEESEIQERGIHQWPLWLHVERCGFF